MRTVTVQGIAWDVDYDYTPREVGSPTCPPSAESWDVTAVMVHDSDVDLRDVLAESVLSEIAAALASGAIRERGEIQHDDWLSDLSPSEFAARCMGVKS